MENFPQASRCQILTEQERDEQYRQILGQLQLGAIHQSHLIREPEGGVDDRHRGLGEYIDRIGFRSWQGIEVKKVTQIESELHQLLCQSNSKEQTIKGRAHGRQPL